MFFRPLFYMGGTEIAILNLIRNLDKEKYIIYIGYSDDTSDKDLLARLSKYSNNIVNVVKERVDVDILINCSPYSSTIPLLNYINYNKLYLWFHHFGSPEKSIFNNIEHISKIDKIIAVSEATKTTMLNQPYSKYIKSKVSVIYNILDQKYFLEKANKPITCNNIDFSNELNLITISRLAPEKGFTRKLIIAQELRKRNINFKWFIIGSSYYQYIENEIKDLFMEFKDNFVFLGMLENPYNILKMCDYLITMSDYETWGLTITEAKLLQVPCIVTNFEAAYEQIEDGKNGIILNRYDTSLYKDRITDILTKHDFFKENLKDFKYDNSLIIRKWKRILI